MHKQKYKKTDFISDKAFTEEQCDTVLQLVSSDNLDGKQDTVLSGRGTICYAEISGLGPVVIKEYRRGGFLGKVNPNLYLKTAESRPEQEFRMLKIAAQAGVSTPKPLAAIVQGSRATGNLFYRGWLMMQHLDHQDNLASLSVNDADRAYEMLPTVAKELGTMIDSSIFHQDLHPGNILVSEDGSVSVIDFDKAYEYKGTIDKLKRAYLLRWRRAVIKHQLPEFLSEFVSAILRSNGGRQQ